MGKRSGKKFFFHNKLTLQQKKIYFFFATLLPPRPHPAFTCLVQPFGLGKAAYAVGLGPWFRVHDNLSPFFLLISPLGLKGYDSLSRSTTGFWNKELQKIYLRKRFTPFNIYLLVGER